MTNDPLRSPFLGPDEEKQPRLLLILEHPDCGGFHQVMLTEDQHDELVEFMEGLSKPDPSGEGIMLPIAHHTHFPTEQFEGVPEFYEKLPDYPDD